MAAPAEKEAFQHTSLIFWVRRGTCGGAIDVGVVGVVSRKLKMVS